eukprot:CAMPEP_0114499536 /NCGR_PEP_ID=MMETSP0109-20121206/7473_1 /TAXON_ID=29199 /ORGANISM="Chlorarachnion reptans, Strain CCCM449" /LENGTH=443 /DNA_ID=CAMNT_0001677117 /DNA_START=267 /DNA_END=1598 /DNA_ORIENTATION=+
MNGLVGNKRKRKKRRSALDLEDAERWNCPFRCGKFYKNTSTKSIHNHLEECTNRPQQYQSTITSMLAQYPMAKKAKPTPSYAELKREIKSPRNSKAKKTSVSKKTKDVGGRKVTSKYIGVSYHANRGKWQVKIRSNGKQKHLGYFEDEDDAARAYNRAAKAVHSNPKINQVPEDAGTAKASEIQQQNLSLDARIQDMTKQQAKDGKGMRQTKQRRPKGATSPYGAYSGQPLSRNPILNKRQTVRSPGMRNMTQNTRVNQRVAHVVSKPQMVITSPSRSQVLQQRWSKPETSFLQVEINPREKPRQDFRMSKLTKEIDTPTLLGSTFSQKRNTNPVQMHNSSAMNMVSAVSNARRSNAGSSLRTRAPVPLAGGSLQIDLGFGLNPKRKIRSPDAMLKLTPVDASGITSGKPGFMLEHPSLGGMMKEGPGDLFPTISPGFNTYCT